MKLKYIYLFITIFAAFSAYSMEGAQSTGTDLPVIELEKAKIRLIYQAEAAFLHNDSSYDYLVTTHLWPCAGLLFSYNNYHLLVHKDDLVDVNSVQELFPKMGVLEDQHRENIQVIIFSRKMREDIYNKKGPRKTYKGKTQEQELERVKGVIESFGIPTPNIRVILNQGYETTLVVNKQGQIFKAWQFNKNLFAIDGIEIVTPGPFASKDQADKIREVDHCFLSKSSNRIIEAYKSWPRNGLQQKPYMHELEAPLDWPTLHGTTCEIVACHNVAKSRCSCCKRVSYCSTQCQKLDWPHHKNRCNAKS